MTTETRIDPAKAEAFGGQMIGIMNGAGLSLMISVGYRSGLFETMATLPPSTSAEIAAASGLNERYVREWLAAMAVGHIIDLDVDSGRYALPPEHAMSLTVAAGPNNLAVLTQFIAMFGSIEDEIVNSFRHGGGVPYSRFPTFQSVMAQMSGQVFDAALVDVILALVPGLKERLIAGIDVADVGCGRGHAVNLMAQAFPSSRFVGYDFSEEGIAAGRDEAMAMGLTNARFEVKDAATLDASTQFDLVTVFDAVHDQAQPRRVLKGIADSLKPAGLFLCADVAASSHVHENMEHPLAPMMYTVSTFHCMTVSLALDGEGLGAMWGQQKALELMHKAGFASVEVKQIEGDFLNNYYIARKD